jgi:predicted permease
MLATVSIIMPLSALFVLRVAVTISKRRLERLSHHEVEFVATMWRVFVMPFLAGLAAMALSFWYRFPGLGQFNATVLYLFADFVGTVVTGFAGAQLVSEAIIARRMRRRQRLAAGAEVIEVSPS